MPFAVTKFRGDGDLVSLEELGVSVKAQFNITAVGASAANAPSAANSTYWTFGTDRHEYYVWYNVTGTNLSVADPVVTGRIGIPVTMNVSAIGFASNIADATVAELSKLSEISVTGSAVGFRVVMREFGAVACALAASAADAGGTSASVFVTAASNLAGVANDFIAAKHVFQASGLIHSIVDTSGSVWDLAASVYRVIDINEGFQGVGSNGTIAANNNDTQEKVDSLVPGDSVRDVVGSNVGGVV